MASSGNFCTWNPIHAQGGGTPDLTRSGTLTNGNLNYSPGSYGIIIGSIGVQTGKWYWELRGTGFSASGPVVGWLNQRHTSGGSNYPSPGYSSPSSAANAQFLMIYLLPDSGSAEIIAGAPSGSSSGTDTDAPTISTNDIIGLAADFDNNKWYFSINGSFTNFRSGQNPATGTNPICSGSSGGGLTTFTRVSGLTWYPTYGNWSASNKSSYANFGQDSTFGGAISAGGNADSNGFGDFKYSPPTGFLAMCSANLPISDDIDPAQTDTDFPQKQFGVVTFTGNGSSRTISGLGFQPDLIWGKRTNSSQRHYLVDSNRGFTKYLHSEDTYSEGGPTSEGVTSANSDGFVIGGSLDYINSSSDTYVAWCWRANGGTTASNSDGSITATVQANTAAGFSIATYTSPGSGTNHTVGHGLSDVDFIITKDRSSTFNWYCFHKSSPNYTYRLNTGSRFSYSNWSMGSSTWGSEDGYTHNSTDDFVAYCWKNVEGFQKFGTYVGNGNSDGPYIYTGFRPRLIFTLQDDSSSGWRVRDTERDTFNPSDSIVWWNRSDRQYDSSGYNFDILSNGFKVRNTGSDFNTSGTTYLYGAWGDVPFKYNNTF